MTFVVEFTRFAAFQVSVVTMPKVRHVLNLRGLP